MCILSMLHLPCIIIMPLPHFFMAIWSIFFIIAASAPPAKAERTRSAASVVLIIIFSFMRLLVSNTVKVSLIQTRNVVNTPRVPITKRWTTRVQLQCLPELFSISGMMTHFPSSNIYPGWQRTRASCFFIFDLAFEAPSATPPKAIINNIEAIILPIQCTPSIWTSLSLRFKTVVDYIVFRWVRVSMEPMSPCRVILAKAGIQFPIRRNAAKLDSRRRGKDAHL